MESEDPNLPPRLGTTGAGVGVNGLALQNFIVSGGARLYSALPIPLQELIVHFSVSIASVFLIQIMALYMRLTGASDKPIFGTGIEMEEWFFGIEIISFTTISIAGLFICVRKMWTESQA